MTLLGNLIIAFAQVVHLLLNAYMWVVIIRAIVSWVNPDPFNPIVRFLYAVTEPVLGHIRRFLPPLGGIDLSPLVVLVAVVFLDQFLVSTIMEFGLSIKKGL